MGAQRTTRVSKQEQFSWTLNEDKYSFKPFWKSSKKNKTKKKKKKTVNRTYQEVKLGKIYTESKNAMQLLN